MSSKLEDPLFKDVRASRYKGIAIVTVCVVLAILVLCLIILSGAFEEFKDSAEDSAPRASSVTS